jgi:hypothetical protein
MAWQQPQKIKKKEPPPPPRKKPDPSLVHTEPLIGCMQLLFPKLFATIFGPGEFHLQRTPYPAFRMSMPRVLNASGTKGPPVTGQEVSWIFLSCEHNFVLGFWFLFWVTDFMLSLFVSSCNDYYLETSEFG